MNAIWAWLAGLMFGPRSDLEDLGVRDLKTDADWERIRDASKDSPQFVFKHSTTCPISASAHGRVADYMRTTNDEVQPPFHLVKVIESRAVSNRIAQDTGVRHESPQLLLLMGGEVVWHASHGSITSDAIAKALEGVAS